MVKFKVQNDNNNNIITFNEDYFSEDIIASLKCSDKHVKIPVHLSLDDLKDESIDDVINRLQGFTRPIKNSDGSVSLNKVNIEVVSNVDSLFINECFLKSFTCKKNESSADLELELVN